MVKIIWNRKEQTQEEFVHSALILARSVSLEKGLKWDTIHSDLMGGDLKNLILGLRYHFGDYIQIKII